MLFFPRCSMTKLLVELIEGIANRILEELGGKATIVATGGYAKLFSELTPIIDVVEPNLTLIGLQLIYDINKS